MGIKMYDMEGHLYGRWLVLKEDAGRDNNQCVTSLCQCQCENKTTRMVNRSSLRNGRSKSCGCLQKEKTALINFIDETGKKHGRLTVLYKTEKKGTNGQYYWMCECECGNKKVVRGDSLRDGSIQSCGCLHTEKSRNDKKYYPGAKFGYLELLEPTEERYKNEYIIWKCKCWACGNENVKVSTKALNQGKKSCCISNSVGEKVIIDLLNENNIKYIKEYTTDNCRYLNTNQPARFDFYIPDLKYIIEFDGIQHFKQGIGKYDNLEKFKETQNHDNFKNQWCEENNIPLIRIPYWHLDELKIDDLLLEKTEFLI